MGGEKLNTYGEKIMINEFKDWYEEHHAGDPALAELTERVRALTPQVVYPTLPNPGHGDHFKRGTSKEAD